MDNFRRQYNKHPHSRKPESLDGFLPSNGTIGEDTPAFKRRFATQYTPNSHQEFIQSRRDLNRSAAPSADGFYARNTAIDTDKFEAMGTSPDQSEGSLEHSAHGNDDVYRPPGILGGHLSHKRSKSSHKTKSKRRKRIVRSVAVAIVLLLIGTAGLFGYSFLKASKIFHGNGEGAAALDENVDPAKLKGEGDGRINILILGKGGPGHEAPDLTDTLLLASIDPVQNEAALLSVPRDLYVEDKNGYATKINAIYSNAKQAEFARSNNQEQSEVAGLNAIEEAVTEVLGVPVHYYAMVDFIAFQKAIDVVGGLDIQVKEPLYDWSVAWLLNGNPLVADEGLQTMDGKRALLYARSRMGSARGDFDRTERQRDILVALQKEVLSSSTLANPKKLYDLLGAFGDNVRTDLNGIDEVKRLFEIGQNIGQDKIVSVSLADDPVLVTTDFINEQSIVRPIAGLNEYEDIHTFVRNTLRDARLKQENSRVVILNGTTTPGLATAREKELKSYGYNVVSVDNAPTSDYVSSRLISLNPAAHKYTESYLTKRLGLNAENVTIEGIPTPDQADFVIILGSDEALKKTSN